MLGIVLAAISNIFQEVSDSIGKYQVREGAASFYTFGFLTVFFGTMFLLAEGLVRNELVFSLASLPTFLPRTTLEILQAHVTARAVTTADRGDFGFIKTLTIPLLLAVDLALGYSVGVRQIAGMLLILSVVIILLFSEGWRVRGLWYLLASAVNAAVTISLYKYDISHFNSVEAEQGLIGIMLMAYFFVRAQYSYGENPLRFLGRKVFFAQSAASGLASVATSFAYLFAPASVITAALRSFAVLFAIISGRIYFREQQVLVKALLFVFMLAGLALLIA